MKPTSYDQAVEKFRKVLLNPEMKQGMKDIIEVRDVVLARYQPMFQLENIPALDDDDFRSFLYFENNRHWSGLYRHGLALSDDMELLRGTLAILLDPNIPLVKRYDTAVGRLKGLGKALATAILLVSSPNEYGVWNNTSERALREVGLWQENVRGKTPGQQYEQINRVLLRLAMDLGIDLWTLDALMWGLIPEEDDDEQKSVEPVSPVGEDAAHFFLSGLQHPTLKARLAMLTMAPLDTAMREAGVVFEHYIRSKSDPEGTRYGSDLVDDALKPGGKLVFSSHHGEQEGIRLLYSGAMKFIRNPPMHKLIDYPEGLARQFFRLIDALLVILDHAALAGEITVDDLRFMLKQKPLRSNHLMLFRILNAAGTKGISARKLAEEMKLTPQQSSGVLGALGRRINRTEGLEEKGGILLILEITETSGGEWWYGLRTIFQKALEEERLI